MIDPLPHIIHWISSGNPMVRILPQVISPDAPDTFALVREVAGGIDNQFPLKRVFFLQILAQAPDDYTAREIAQTISDFVGEQYDFTLAAPPDIAGSQDVRVAQIKSQHRPAPLGNAGNGLFLYSTTFTITF